jgi:hypothetical protein
MIKPLGLGYQKLDICPNFYMLYYSENADFTKYKTCEHSQYKPKTSRGMTLIAHKKTKILSNHSNAAKLIHVFKDF